MTIRDKAIWLDIVQNIVVILGVCFAAYQLKLQVDTLQATKEIESGKFVLELSRNIDADKYKKIINAIEDHDANFPILKSSGGSFSDSEIEDYIGNFETIGDFENRQIIDRRMAYNEFSYPIEKAWCNKDIRQHIVETRKRDNVPSDKVFFSNFENLARSFLKEDKRENCNDIP